jgi:hypothetical protein
VPRQLLSLLAGTAALLSSPLHAQSPELLRIDSLLAQSRFTDARAALQQWQLRGSAKPGEGDVAYALMLRARLAPRADSALAAWLELALGHPSSRLAPEALLRLGQGYAALGQHERAAGWLERIQRDHPGFPGRFIAAAWLARSQRASGRTAAACTTVARVRNAPGMDAAGRQLLQAEWAECGGAAPTPPAVEGRFTVQAAAFRDRGAAVSLARRLRDHGIPARVVILGKGGTLNLVRAGRFPNAAAAAPLLNRVRALVPGALVAADAHREAGASR